MPELVCSVPSARVFEALDLDSFDGAYLGQPYCLLVEGNFITDLANLRVAIQRLHAAGKRAYLSTPAVPSTRELAITRKAIEVAAEEGIDGVEAHDMGVFRMLRGDFPQLKTHIGHFANVYHIETARAFLKMGANRILPSYELTIDEKRAFAQLKAEGAELEVPVAGKLPVGMAHACLLRLDQKTWTQEPCIQQCAERRELDFGSSGWAMRSAGTAMLMAEDLVMIEHLRDLIEAGMDAFRMETSLEPAKKINALGKHYRAALDDARSGRSFDAANLEAVTALCDRGACNGWYFGESGREYVEGLYV